MPAPKKNKQPGKRKPGRPTCYTEEIADKIISLVSSTSWGLEKICKKSSGLPHAATVRRWIADNKAFCDRYVRAKEEQADLLADEIIGICDELSARGNLTNVKVNAARLRVDARKWVAAKLKPKTYGEKIDATTNGESLNKGFYDFLKATSGIKSED